LYVFRYAASFTCGPDPKICCQFDFKKLREHCDTGGPQPVPITSENTKERSLLLADQYRKKAQIYKENVILVPLGDDFRYMDKEEWEDQYQNYKKLFKSINDNRELNINVSFWAAS
jgi:alpha-mannosidase II